MGQKIGNWSLGSQLDTFEDGGDIFAWVATAYDAENERKIVLNFGSGGFVYGAKVRKVLEALNDVRLVDAFKARL